MTDTSPTALLQIVTGIALKVKFIIYIYKLPQAELNFKGHQVQLEESRPMNRQHFYV
jgi:hypothetical protein